MARELCIIIVLVCWQQHTRTCTAAGLYSSSSSDCSPFSSSVYGSGCPSRRRCVKAVACSPEQPLDLDTHLLFINTSKFAACKSRHLHSGLGENECSEVGWGVVGCSGVACAVWWSAVGWMSHETKEWFRKWLEGQADPKRELVPLPA